MSESFDWTNEAINLEDVAQAEALIARLIAVTNLNRMAQCRIGNDKASEYLERNEESPVGLVRALQVLYKQPSGFTGLTVYEAYVRQLHSQNK
jgi:hypothetical protein